MAHLTVTISRYRGLGGSQIVRYCIFFHRLLELQLLDGSRDARDYALPTSARRVARKSEVGNVFNEGVQINLLKF